LWVNTGLIVGAKLVENRSHLSHLGGATLKLRILVTMLSEYLSQQLGSDLFHPKQSLHRRLYEALRRALLDGHVAAGDRLPSSRDLAGDLKLSRNTVVAAINQLSVEGYLMSQVGSGTYASDNLPQNLRAGRAASKAARSKPLNAARMTSFNCQAPTLSKRGQQLSTAFTASSLEVQPFTPGSPDFSAFPVKLWQRLQNKHWRFNYAEMLDYSSTGGYAPLRRAVADYLRVFRSVQLEAEQVLITSGTQQSLELCAHLLADHGDTVWIEDPAYWGAVKAFMATGLKLHAVKVDDQGIAPQASDDAQAPRLIYVTPSHQYPTGSVMSLARRQRLLERARAHKAWILEDDYDSEFRYSGPPVSSLEGLDTDERVLYMGTFSKVMYPGIKLGYLVVPKPLVEAFKQAHYDLNRPGQLPVQAALAEFIEQGHFASTIRRMRQSYSERRAALLHALAPVLIPYTPSDINMLASINSHKRAIPGTSIKGFISGAEQGLHLCLHLAPHIDDRAIARAAADQHLSITPLSGYCITRKDLRGLVIGYGYASLKSIEQHAPKLTALLQAASPK
jgi:GntR family transcriptional regulator / MocR family aminotransferase